MQRLGLFSVSVTCAVLCCVCVRQINEIADNTTLLSLLNSHHKDKAVCCLCMGLLPAPPRCAASGERLCLSEARPAASPRDCDRPLRAARLHRVIHAVPPVDWRVG